uniref:Uncharacterized protein n=1 Tax=Ficedula albicollis TaxID=59894 RepID=A0A803V5E5_FICAL
MVIGEGIGVFHHFCPLLQISELINRPIPHQGEGACRLPVVWQFPSGFGVSLESGSGFGVSQGSGSGFGVSLGSGSGFGVSQGSGSGFGVSVGSGSGFGVSLGSGRFSVDTRCISVCLCA